MPLSVERRLCVLALALEVLKTTTLLTFNLREILDSAVFEISDIPRCASPFLLNLGQDLKSEWVMMVFKTELFKNLRCLQSVEIGRFLIVEGRASVVCSSIPPPNLRFRTLRVCASCLDKVKIQVLSVRLTVLMVLVIEPSESRALLLTLRPNLLLTVAISRRCLSEPVLRLLKAALLSTLVILMFRMLVVILVTPLKTLEWLTVSFSTANEH